MKVRGVVFDLYGVLGLNGWQDFKLRHFEGRWEQWEPLRLLGQRVDAGLATDDEFVTAITQVTGESEDAVRYQFEHTKPNRELLEYIGDTLKGKVKIGLLSNASHDVLGGVLGVTEREYFDAVLLSAHIGLTKPDTKMFTQICTMLDLDSTECIMVDDQARHLESAAKIGMRTVLYTDNGSAIRQIDEWIQK